MCLSLAIGAAALQPCVVSAQTAQTSPEPLALEVRLNGRPVGLIGNFVRTADGRFWATPQELVEIGFELERLPKPQDGLIAVDRLPQAKVDYDVAQQMIDIAVSPAVLRVTRLSAIHESSAQDAQVTTGAVLNYSLIATGETPLRGARFEQPTLGGEFEARAFGRFGLVSSSALITNSLRGTLKTVRLDTSWTIENSRSLATMRAGDLITHGLSWTRPVRLGGLQISRSFHLRPDLITQPLSLAKGTAEVPSALDVLIDNAPTFSEQIPQGPFELRIPIRSGGGVASVRVHDVLGRESIIDLPFYGSDGLLAPGYTDFSVEAGFLRRNFGTKSSDYDPHPAAVGSFRMGLASNVTGAAHVEATADFANVGGGLVLAWAPVALVSAAGAISTSPRGSGGMVDFSVESRQSRFFGSVRVVRSYGAYDDLASRSSTQFRLDGHGASPKRIDQVQIGGSLWSSQSVLSMSYSRVDHADDQIRLGTVSISQSIGALNLYLRASQDFASAHSRTLGFGLSLPLGRAFATSDVSTGRAGTSGIAEVQSRAPVAPGEFGWRARIAAGELPEVVAAASAMTRYGLVEAGLRKGQGTSSGFVQATGGIAFMGGRVFASKRIDGAFAVVDVGQADVPVTHENRTIGVTGRRGAVLVAGLLPYQQNRVGVDARYLKLDRELASETVSVSPRSGSGVVVRIASERHERSALVRLVAFDGTAVPVGSTARLTSGGTFVVGYDGQVFLPEVKDDFELIVEYAPGRTCTASVTMPREAKGQLQIGPIRCIPFVIASR